MGRKRESHPELPERVVFRHGAYYYRPAGSNRWVHLGRDYAQAMMAWAKLLNRPSEMANIGQVMDRYLLEIAPGKAKRTFRDNIKEMANLKTFFGRLHPDDIDERMIYQYMDERGAEVRANRELSLLSGVFKKAIRWGAASRNPVASVERFPEIHRRRYVADWELEIFKAVSSPMIRAYCDLKYMTGLRKGDILTLTRSSLTEEGIYVAPRKSQRKHPKTGEQLLMREQTFEWTDELRAAVDAVLALKKGRAIHSVYLFSTRDGKSYYDIEKSRADGFDAIWKRYMAKAKEEAKRQGKVLEHFTEHDIRAKNASDEENEAEAQKRLGHASVKQTRDYRRKVDKVQPLRRKVSHKTP